MTNHQTEQIRVPTKTERRNEHECAAGGTKPEKDERVVEDGV